MVRSLPLRNGFFAVPQLSSTDELELVTWARSLVPELCHTDHTFSSEWTIVHEKKGIQVSEDRQKGGLTYSIKSIATIKASLDDIMDTFITSTTQEYRTLMQLQLRELFYDSAVLYHKEQNDAESLGIKWFAVKNKKSAINPMGQNQDFCLLEYTGVLHAQGLPPATTASLNPDQLVGVCLYESIEQQECPSLWDSHRLERGSLSKCGYIFRPRDDGVVEAQFICSIRQPASKSSTRRLNRNVLLAWAESLLFIEESISRKRISRELTQRRGPTWVNDKDRQCCHLCLKTFTNMRRKHHCRACGEIICRNCSMYKSVDLQSVGLTTLRVCKACMDGTKTPNDREMSDLSNGGVNEEKLRHAVEEYALALPKQQVAAVPDLVGIAWLRQIAARDPSKKEMVNELMQQMKVQVEDTSGSQPSSETEQVDIYDTLCDLAAQTLACKYAVVSLIDENRQWFKSAVNVSESDVPRDFSFCEYPVRDQRPLVVMDALRDPRFMHHPFVTGPLGVRFLAGAPLYTVDNECVGAVCVLDTEPRHTLQESQLATMQNLAHLAMVMVQERREAQDRLMSVAASSQLVSSSRSMYHHNPGPHHGGYYNNRMNDHRQQYSQPQSQSSDLVPLSSYSNMEQNHTLVVQTSKPPSNEDPVLKEQMIQLLQKASQVRDQVKQNQQSMNVQHAGLQSSAE